MLLYQVLIKNKKCQPHYIIEAKCSTYKIEIERMETIRERLINKFPEKKEMILETIYEKKNKICINPKICGSLNNLREIIPFGRQYDWLASYCHQNSIKKMGFGHEKLVENEKYDFVKNYLVIKDDGYEVDEKYNTTDYYAAFQYFNYPIFDFTKQDMVSIAKDNDFLDIMNLTWFCHKPLKNGYPLWNLCTMYDYN